MNSINSVIIAMFTLLYPASTDLSEEDLLVKLTPGDMVKSCVMKTYQPINHEETASFSLWEQKIKASLVEKTSKKTTKK